MRQSLYVIRQILLVFGVFAGLAVKVAGLFIALPAVPNLLLHGLTAMGHKGVFEPFMSLSQTMALFVAGMLVSASGLGLLAFCLSHIGSIGGRVVAAAIFGGAASFFGYCLFTMSITTEGVVILSLFTFMCTAVTVIALGWGFEPRSRQIYSPQAPAKLEEDAAPDFSNVVPLHSKSTEERRTYH